MIDKISLLSKIKLSVLHQNISLGSLADLPSHLKKDLKSFLEKALLSSKHEFFKGDLEILSEKEFFLPKSSNIPQFSQGDLVLIIIPERNKRYVFQTIVKEITSEGYKLKILIPREDEKLVFKNPPQVFISFISHHLFLKLLKQEFFLVRGTNFSVDSSTFKDIKFYDLVFDEKNKIDEEFKKLIQRHDIDGELLDINNAGAFIKKQGIIKIPKDIYLMYLNFEIFVLDKELKFALLCHLRNSYVKEGALYLHLMFLLPFKPEIWSKIKEIIKPLNRLTIPHKF